MKTVLDNATRDSLNGLQQAKNKTDVYQLPLQQDSNAKPVER